MAITLTKCSRCFQFIQAKKDGKEKHFIRLAVYSRCFRSHCRMLRKQALNSSHSFTQSRTFPANFFMQTSTTLYCCSQCFICCWPNGVVSGGSCELFEEEGEWEDVCGLHFSHTILLSVIFYQISALKNMGSNEVLQIRKTAKEFGVCRIGWVEEER